MMQKSKTNSSFVVTAIDRGGVSRPTPLTRAIRYALYGSLCGATLVANGAWADDDNTTATAAADTHGKVQTVVVTAQKRSESVKEVPISVEVVDGEALSSQGMVKLVDYFSQIPGLSYTQNYMSSAIVMRGIGTDSGIGVRPTAGVVVDDVPYGSATNTGVIPDLDPSDLRQVEVLRGPQGTLYGASSMGGLIKYVMNDPDTKHATRRIEVGSSTVSHGDNGFIGRFAINQPIGDDIALRISAFRRKDPGFIKDVNSGATNDSDVKGARIAAIWKVSKDVTIRASSTMQMTSTDASPYSDVHYDFTPIYGTYEHSRVVGADTYDARSQITTFKVNADLGFATLDAITGYNSHRQFALQDVSYTSIGSAAPGLNAAFGLGLAHPGALIQNGYNSQTPSQELRLSSKDEGKLQWLVGLFFSSERVQSKQNFYLAEKLVQKVVEDPALLTSEDSSTYKTTALFGDTTYRFTEQFDIQTGVRFARGKYSSNSVSGGALTDPDVTSGVNRDHNFTYLVSPRYKFDKNLMAYLRVSSGYRPGGDNGVLSGSTAPASYKSDTLNSYELGFKGTFLNQTLSLDSALYRINWSDLQLSQVDLTYGSSYTTNAGKATSTGLELSGTWLPTQDWKVKGTYAYTDAKLASDIPGFVQGSTAYGLSGDRLPYSAKQTAALNVTRFFTVGNNLDLFVGANANYVGDRLMEFVQSSTVPRIHLPSYTTYGLNLGLQGINWTLTTYVHNLSDKVAYTNANRRAASLSSGTSATLGAAMIAPRTIGATLSWDL
ncbi:TonB-dependent receptor plug domain-containing protein [Duganella sp. FT80W]|uniref:TonB-dependent receptor plug domain-containing protein n=1 Tax=Duganella guangzhouensis TaxID=2666084 RepID=A0A6I2L2F8_9BURK|nr:TonB-dependent receptor [Duganella guangzhouensis]MRW91417.1 TonB-dependent receptor plug domain-containing protein [Duganella guangzhouensis]